MSETMKAGLMKLAESVPNLLALGVIVWLFVGLQGKQMEVIRQLNDRCMAARVEERVVIEQCQKSSEKLSGTMERNTEALTKLASAVDKMKR